MAHQFTALHLDAPVELSRESEERLREVNLVAWALITEMIRNINAGPCTLGDIMNRSKKPGNSAIRDAYQDLIKERLIVPVQYTLYLDRKRPYPSSTTLISPNALREHEVNDLIVPRYKPGQTVQDLQKDGKVRRAEVASCRIRCWFGTRKVTPDGDMVKSEAKPQPKQVSINKNPDVSAITWQPKKPDGYVYAIGEPGSSVVKLGLSTNVDDRFKQIQATSPRPLRVLWKAKGGNSTEGALHDRFSAERIHGEWFDFSQHKRDPVDLVREASRELNLVELET